METLKPGGTAKRITLLRPLDNCLGRVFFTENTKWRKTMLDIKRIREILKKWLQL